MSRPVILVVSDDLRNRELLRACLESTCDVHFVDAADRALDERQCSSIDLVLLDVRMTGGDGSQLCRSIKARAKGYMPVILQAAVGIQEDRNAGLEAGADDVLYKPFDPRELLSRVRTFVRLREQDRTMRRQLTALREQERVVRGQVDELMAVAALKDDLVSLLVHDLRNPLTSVAGYLEALAQATDPAVRNDAIPALIASERIRERLDDLLSVRMLEAPGLPLHRTLISAESLVEEAIASLRGAARAREIEISWPRSLNDLRINADAKLILRAIENLVGNAIKYSPSRGVVRICARSNGQEVEIEVVDQGFGIPPEFQRRAFDKFASVEVAQGQPRRGLGLGLYLVGLVASAHGGRASVKNCEGGGASFTLYLPVA